MPSLLATSSTDVAVMPAAAEAATLSGPPCTPGAGLLFFLALKASAIESASRLRRSEVGAPANPKSGSYATLDTITALWNLLIRSCSDWQSMRFIEIFSLLAKLDGSE